MTDSVDEERIDDVYQGAFRSIEENVESEVGMTTRSPHPSAQAFIGENGSVTVQLGKGLSFYVDGSDEEVSEPEFRDKVPDSEAEYLIASAQLWNGIGKKQAENLSEEYLQRYM